MAMIADNFIIMVRTYSRKIYYFEVKAFSK